MSLREFAEPAVAAREPSGAATKSGRGAGNPPLAIGLKVASTFAFVLMLTCIKAVGEAVPPGEVVFARSAFALVPIVLMLAWQGALRTALKTSRPWSHVGRGLVGVVAMGLWFAAVPYLPLPEGMAITYATPLLIVVLAALVLRERVGVYRWTAVAIGFLGILVILWPRLTWLRGGSAEDAVVVAAILALASSFCMATAAMFIRSLTASETTAAIVFYFSLISSAAALLTAPFGWVAPSPTHAALLVGAGLLGGVGQILLTHAYHHAEASVVAPFEYVSMLWVVAVGFLVFEEVPQSNVLLGAAIVIGAGMFILYRERRLALARARHDTVAPRTGRIE